MYSIIYYLKFIILILTVILCSIYKIQACYMSCLYIYIHNLLSNLIVDNFIVPILQRRKQKV